MAEGHTFSSIIKKDKPASCPKCGSEDFILMMVEAKPGYFHCEQCQHRFCETTEQIYRRINE